MSVPHLNVTRRMLNIHGKTRAVIEIQAVIDPAIGAMLTELFPNETLFKRTAFAGGFADGGLQPSPPLGRMMMNFMKNDACPEVTVKTLLAGQKYEGTGIWDVLCFEFIAKRSFDALVELAEGASGFGTTATYFGFNVPANADAQAFAVDTAAELAHVAPGPAAITVCGVERVADAA